MLNRQLVLQSRPVGVPQPEHFKLIEVPLRDLQRGEFMVENIFLSVDPAQRGYVNDENNYSPPVAIGEVMRALAVGRVVASKHADFNVGGYLYGWFGWQDYCVCSAPAVLRRINSPQVPLSLNAGLLGINGLTAYLALKDIGQPKANETIVVTAAAGAVGSVVGQLAKLAGARTVAIVGSDEKGAQCLSEFGYDAYINYRRPLDHALSETCPNGVDIFFDNVSGEIADTLLSHMNLHGRVIQCGTMAISSWVPAPQGPRYAREILTRRLRMEGFVIFDHIARYDSAAAELVALWSAGKIHVTDDIETKIEQAPQALVDVYAGRNRGKKIIQLRAASEFQA